MILMIFHFRFLKNKDYNKTTKTIASACMFWIWKIHRLKTLSSFHGKLGKCTKWGNVRRTPKVVRNSPKGVRRSPNVSERCPTDSEIVQKVSDGVRRFFWVRKVRNVSENVRSDPVGLRKIRFSPIRIPKRSEWVRYNFRTNLSKFRNKKLNF